MEDLKKLIGDELYSQVAIKLGDNSLGLIPKGKKSFIHDEKDTVVISNNGEWVPASKIKDLSDEKRNLTDQLSELNTSLEKIKGENKKNEELTGKLQELQVQIENNKKASIDLEKRYALRDMLKDNGAKYVDLLETKFDFSKIELENGKIKEFDKHLSPVKESYKELFGEKFIAGNTPNRGQNVSAPNEVYTLEEIKSMDQRTVVENIDKVNKSLEYHNKN